MTTIAITTSEIAADGQRTWGSEIRDLDFQKIRIKGETIYAFTGCVPMYEPIIAWHQAGSNPDKLPGGYNHNEEGWTLIAIDRNGLGKFTSSCPYREEFEPPIAFGAGGDYAMGAMLQGATAGQAVQIVAGLCNHTGGHVQVVNIQEVTGFSLRRTVLKEAAE